MPLRERHLSLSLDAVSKGNPQVMNFRSIVAALLVALGSQSAEAAEAEPLPALCVDENAISVSGISSGAFFAHQFHVAHSRRVKGAGIFAGGPNLCAGENFPHNLFRSLNVCSNTGSGSFRGPPQPQRSISAARIAAAAGRIDDVSGLRGDRVFLFSGRLDTLVPTSVLDAVQSFYRAFDNANDIAFVSDVDAAHAMVTDTFGNACDTSESPHLNACGYDLAGATLAHIYGPLEPARTAEGELLAFTQTEFVKAGDRHGLAPTGYAYVPEDCAHSAGCRLHVAFHGCLQNTDTIGDAFIRHAGYNEWAEANRILVLYPQAAAVTGRVAGIPVDWPNPKGCWDWWGFTGTNFARKAGSQISAVDAMIDRLAGKTGVNGSSAAGGSCAQADGE